MHVEPPPPSGSSCLFLDVDGTLLEHPQVPGGGSVDAALKRLLQSLDQILGGALALVSGRRIASIDALFAPLELCCAGLHGVERRGAGMCRSGSSPDLELQAALAQLHALARSHRGLSVENKGLALAVHHSYGDGDEHVLRAELDVIVGQLGPAYQLLDGRTVFEIKPRRYNKGTAVREFMLEAPFAARRPLYVGDDSSDLDGFRAVEALGGASVAVGARVDAQYRLNDPRAVRAWLGRFVQART